jgi:hypothetical protein
MIRSLAQTPAAVSAETQPHPSRVLCIRLRKTCRSFEMVSSPYAVARLVKKPVRTRRRLPPFVGVAHYSRKCTCCIGTDTPENGRKPFTTPPLRAGPQGAKVELRMGGSNSYAGSKASRHPRKQRNLEGERFWQLLRRKLRPQRFTGVDFLVKSCKEARIAYRRLIFNAEPVRVSLNMTIATQLPIHNFITVA